RDLERLQETLAKRPDDLRAKAHRGRSRERRGVDAGARRAAGAADHSRLRGAHRACLRAAIGSKLRLVDRADGNAAIYVVDDTADVRELVTTQLQKLGYTAIAFSSGEECIDAIAIARPSCVLIDL